MFAVTAVLLQVLPLPARRTSGRKPDLPHSTYVVLWVARCVLKIELPLRMMEGLNFKINRMDLGWNNVTCVDNCGVKAPEGSHAAGCCAGDACQISSIPDMGIEGVWRGFLVNVCFCMSWGVVALSCYLESRERRLAESGLRKFGLQEGESLLSCGIVRSIIICHLKSTGME